MHEGKVHCSLIMALFLASLSNCDETNNQYLQSVVRSLKNLRQIQTFRRGDIAQIKEESEKIRRRSHQYTDDVPPLTLTKGELVALYEQAASKGETIKLDTGNNEYLSAVVHHMDDDTPSDHVYNSHPKDEKHGPSEDDGYYYYYYPIKSFLDEITSEPTGYTGSYHKPPYHHKELTTYKPPFTYHSHHHQHNITIQAADKEKKDAKPLEPLFMAISGFIGMAVMFIVSMVLFPKFGIKPKIFNEIKKKEKLDDFARFALNAIEGHCAERFACELTKTARSFDMEENRFYKLLKRMAPGSFGRLINNTEKYANKHLKCTAIPCKSKQRPNNNNNPNNKKKPPNNNQKKKNVNKKH